MIKISLHKNDGFKWFHKSGLYVKGYFYNEKGEFFSNEKLLDFFYDLQDIDHLIAKINRTNGLFSVILHHRNIVLLIVDRLRMFPLFHANYDNDVVITDTPDIFPNSYNLDDEDEFLATGFVSRDKTLLENVYQLQAGELKIFDQEWKSHFYYHYSIVKDKQITSTDIESYAFDAFNNTIKNLINGLNNRTAIIPLSGGYDSRWIAAALKLNNYENVICFSYGRKGNKESEISEKAAKQLGFKWFFVEYNDGLINSFIQDETFSKYYKYSSNYTSQFYMQEYFAVKFLKDQQLIPTDAIFIPGHSGDFLGGSQITKYNIKKNYSLHKLACKLFHDKYIVEKKTKKKHEFKANIEAYCKRYGKGQFAYSVYEDWDMKEKLSKYIANSCNIYNFFGYEHRLPFWDLELVDFFKDLPYHLKLNKIFYDKIIKEKFFVPLQLIFEEDKKDFSLRFQRIKDFMKQFMSQKFHDKRLHKRDNIYYDEITSILRTDMDARPYNWYKTKQSFNSYIRQWYISKINQ